MGKQSSIDVFLRGSMVELELRIGMRWRRVLLQPSEAILLANTMLVIANQANEHARAHTCLFCKQPTAPHEAPDCCAACAAKIG